MYEKKLKRSKDGLFIRYIGRNQKGTPEKFRLGYDPLLAEERVRLIAALWHEIENFRGERRSGTGRTLRRQRRSLEGCHRHCQSGTLKTPPITCGVSPRPVERLEPGSSRWTPRATRPA